MVKRAIHWGRAWFQTVAASTLVISSVLFVGTGQAEGQVVDARPKCYGKVATIVGTERDDKIVGTAGADVIVGRGGMDRIYGGGGNDVI